MIKLSGRVRKEEEESILEESFVMVQNSKFMQLDLLKWRMDLTAAEKRRLQQAEAKASAEYHQRPRFYLDEKKIKVKCHIYLVGEI